MLVLLHYKVCRWTVDSFTHPFHIPKVHIFPFSFLSVEETSLYGSQHMALYKCVLTH